MYRDMPLKPRFALVFKSCGLQEGDTIHMVINNNIYYHAIVLATWRMGCKVSTGDTALDHSAIKFQVSASAVASINGQNRFVESLLIL